MSTISKFTLNSRVKFLKAGTEHDRAHGNLNILFLIDSAVLMFFDVQTRKYGIVFVFGFWSFCNINYIIISLFFQSINVRPC